jgi:hypothetical protein
MLGISGHFKTDEESLSHFRLGFVRLGQVKTLYALLLQDGQVRPGLDRFVRCMSCYIMLVLVRAG